MIPQHPPQADIRDSSAAAQTLHLQVVQERLETLDILQLVARDPRLARTSALAVAVELAAVYHNGQAPFTVAGLMSALVLARSTIGAALKRLARLGYLEEIVTHRVAGQRAARLTYPPATTTTPPPDATR